MDKKQLLTVAAIAAGALAAFFLFKKYKTKNDIQAWDEEELNSMQTVPTQPSRHITKVFSKAKQQA